MRASQHMQCMTTKARIQAQSGKLFRAPVLGKEKVEGSCNTAGTCAGSRRFG